MSTRFRAAGERCSSRFPAASFSEFGGILFYRGADKKLHSILKKNMKTGDLNLLKRFSLTFEKVFGFGCFICIIAPSLVSKANCFSRNNAQRRVGSQNWNQKWSQFWEPTSCYFAASFAPLAAPLLLLFGDAISVRVENHTKPFRSGSIKNFNLRKKEGWVGGFLFRRNITRAIRVPSGHLNAQACDGTPTSKYISCPASYSLCYHRRDPLPTIHRISRS